MLEPYTETGTLAGLAAGTEAAADSGLADKVAGSDMAEDESEVAGIGGHVLVRQH